MPSIEEALSPPDYLFKFTLGFVGFLVAQSSPRPQAGEDYLYLRPRAFHNTWPPTDGILLAPDSPQLTSLIRSVTKGVLGGWGVDPTEMIVFGRLTRRSGTSALAIESVGRAILSGSRITHVFTLTGSDQWKHHRIE